MNIPPIIYSLILFIQLPPCGGCPGAPCSPCCGPPNTCDSGGPPPPVGEPIDDYIIFLFIAALVYGLYVIKKMKSKLN